MLINNPPGFFKHDRLTRKELMLNALTKLKPLFTKSDDCFVCVWVEPCMYRKLMIFFSEIGFKFCEQISFIMLTDRDDSRLSQETKVLTQRKGEQKQESALKLLEMNGQFTRKSHKSMLMFRTALK